MRIRSLKPEILEDAKTAGLTDTEFRLFVSLILMADDYGNLRAHPRQVEATVWWAHDDPPNVRETLARLSEKGLVTLYQVHGQPFAHISGWEKHQKVDKPGKPHCPGPEGKDSDDLQNPRETLAKDSRDSGETLGTDLRPPTPIPIPIPTVDCAETAKPSSPPEPSLLDFPVDGKGPKTWGLTRKMLSDLRSAYPVLDVMAEARKALVWIRANPNRHKTAAGMPRFLVNWLNRAQDGRGQRNGNGSAVDFNPEASKAIGEAAAAKTSRELAEQAERDRKARESWKGREDELPAWADNANSREAQGLLASLAAQKGA